MNNITLTLIIILAVGWVIFRQFQARPIKDKTAKIALVLAAVGLVQTVQYVSGGGEVGIGHAVAALLGLALAVGLAYPRALTTKVFPGPRRPVPATGHARHPRTVGRRDRCALRDRHTGSGDLPRPHRPRFRRRDHHAVRRRHTVCAVLVPAAARRCTPCSTAAADRLIRSGSGTPESPVPGVRSAVETGPSGRAKRPGLRPVRARHRQALRRCPGCCA